MSEEFWKWKSLVSGKGPGQPRRGRQNAQGGEKSHDDDGRHHGGRGRDGTGGLIKDLNDRIPRLGLQGRIHVADAKEQGNDPSKREDAIDQNRQDHASGNTGGRIFDFLACTPVNLEGLPIEKSSS